MITHYFKSCPGFHSDLNQQMKKDALIEYLPESQCYVALLIDEMKIKESINILVTLFVLLLLGM